MSTPSELLLAAADRLRDRAAAATPGPWRSGEFEQDEQAGYPNVLDAEGSPLVSSSCCGGHCYGHVTDPADADWIALMSPDLAPHLEAWLRTASQHLAVCGAPTDCLFCAPATAFAASVCPELVEDSDG